jgi:hypothetical protein
MPKRKKSKAGRPKLWPRGTLWCYLRIIPEVARKLGVKDHHGARIAILAILDKARPDCAWGGPLAPKVPHV